MSRHALESYLAALTTDKVGRYLLATGWVTTGSIGKLATIWHREEQTLRDSEIILPNVGVASDSYERLLDLLRLLAEFEKRDELEVADAISQLSADLISVRVEHPDVEAGTIPLDDGVLLNERARDLMASAALSVLSKRRHFQGQRPPEAHNYLGQLRLGQTRIGSYVINVIAPIEESLVQASLETTTFARLVTENLATALAALTEAIDSYSQRKDLSVFDSTVDRGASANMCDALLGFSGASKARSFSISISPAPSQPFVENMVLKHDFGPTRVAAICEAATHLKENYVLKNYVISGYVKRLDREAGMEEGSIAITATLPDGSAKNVTVELSSQNYIEAIHAHENKFVVECLGDVHISPRSAHLLNPTGFWVLSSGDLF